jgi:hypothetical protein
MDTVSFIFFGPHELGIGRGLLNVVMTTGTHALQIDLRLSDSAGIKEDALPREAVLTRREIHPYTY